MSAAEFDLLVVAIDDSIPGVRSLELAASDRRALPSFGPGSHVVVRCGRTLNSYSLTGELERREVYSISVAHRRDGSNGSDGSAWVHALTLGDAVTVSAPRNLFAPVAGARHSVYIAGGIGITPLLSHIREAARRGAGFDVVYVTRAGVLAAHLDEVRWLAGDRLREVRGRGQLRPVLDDLLARQPIGAYMYVCGPPGLTAAALDCARALGWPDERLRFEPFAGRPSAPGRPFRVRLLRRGLELDVAADTSLLDALLAAGVEVDNLCRQGVCGECVLPVRAGCIDHRDHFLTAGERAEGLRMTACVSRADTALELDL